MRRRVVIGLFAAGGLAASGPAAGGLVVGGFGVGVASASNSPATSCLTYPGDTLLDIQGMLRVYVASVPPRPTDRTIVTVYACKPGKTARTTLVVEHDDSDGGYTCAPAVVDSGRKWLGVDCAYVGGTFITDHVYEFPLGGSVGRRSASVAGGALVGVTTTGGLALVDGCDSTLELADAAGVRVVAPATASDPAVGGAHLYWSIGTTSGVTTANGHPSGSLMTPGNCD